MSGFKRYDEDFKQSLVNLYQTGKTQTELCKDYGVSSSALAKKECPTRGRKSDLKKKRVPYSCKTPSKIESHLSTQI